MNEYLFKKALDFAFAKITALLSASKSTTPTSTEDLARAITYHLRDVKNWSEEISFSDLRGSKSTEDIFIPLDLYLQPRRLFIDSPTETEVTPFEELVADPSRGHLVILGSPGAGKTTSMKHLCQRILHDDTFLIDQIDFPVVIRLSTLNNRSSTDGSSGEESLVIGTLQELLGIHIVFSPEVAVQDSKVRRALRDRIIMECLESLRILLILDGLDEIRSKTTRDRIIWEVQGLAQHLEDSRIILTSRTGEFNYHIENVSQFEISPLSRSQMTGFACQWLGDDDGMRLMQQIEESPYLDTAIRPLTLAHLCAIYERVGKVPDRPKTIYRKVVNLLLEEWDQQRLIRRESAYASFDVDRKFEFLAHLAYILTISLSATVFSKQDVIQAYRQMNDSFGLPSSEAAKVASELESHTGLFVQAGYERFEFSHKSLQEYLAAEFIVRLPLIPMDEKLLSVLPNELALATAISSHPSEYLAQLVLGRLSPMKAPFPYFRTFVMRLLAERTDFEHTPRIGATLLVLYSHCVRSLVEIRSASIHAYSDELLVLEDLILQRLEEERIATTYKLHERITNDLCGTVLRLHQRNENSLMRRDQGLPDMVRNNLPAAIWVREVLFKTTTQL